MKINKKLFKASTGQMITQGLFLEIGYTDSAYYTLEDEDKTYKGRVYPSLKKMFLEMEDPTEYSFATEYLLGWQHWQRICANKQLAKHIAEWREELELKLRSQAIMDIVQMSAEEKGFQAAKWLAERGWDKRGVGRPNKDTTEHDSKMDKRLENEFSADVLRMVKG